MRVPLLNFEGRPGVPLLNFEGGPWSRVPGTEVPGPGVLVTLLHHAKKNLLQVFCAKEKKILVIVTVQSILLIPFEVKLYSLEYRRR